MFVLPLGSKNGNPPIQRNAANARERARMRVLSSAFGRLKTKLPNIPPDTKLSKLDTLRLATMYIKQLKVLVEGGAATAESPEAFQESAGIFNMQGVPQSMVSTYFHNHDHLCIYFIGTPTFPSGCYKLRGKLNLSCSGYNNL